MEQRRSWKWIPARRLPRPCESTWGLTGTKIGCNRGECGACTVLVDGKRRLACLILTGTLQGREIRTIESAALDRELQLLQQAFLKHDALQCGFCTPGQLMSARACLAEGTAESADSIREAMSGNLCRCGAYRNINAAILEVASRARDASL